MPDASLFTLPRNAVVQAGAGTGKTHSLVTLCLHLLGGVGRDEPLGPARLWAVTFTEKAAAELKARLRQRIDGLAAGGAEPELEETCARAGRAPPDTAVWRRVRRDLGLAQVGTIHSLCGQILRRHAAAAGLDPRFGVLDERAGRRALREACEDAALDALSGSLGPEVRERARRLCAELGFRGSGRFGTGLADELERLCGALGESGRDAAALADESEGLDPALCARAFDDARRGLQVALEALAQGVRGRPAGAALAVPYAWRLLRPHRPGLRARLKAEPALYGQVVQWRARGVEYVGLRESPPNDRGEHRGI